MKISSTLSKIILSSTLFFISQITFAGNIERENRLVAEIEDSIMDGDGLWLKTKERKFFSIFTEADDSKGTVILIHGRGLHPDWADVISPLRIGLVEQGWSTLALQMPVLEKDATYSDYVLEFAGAIPRINSAIEYIKAESNKPIILLAHSCGAHMATEWIEYKKGFPIEGFITVSAGATDYMQPMLAPFPYNLVKAPILDIYGSEDTPAVIRKAPERLASMNTHKNPANKQVLLKGADHYYHEDADTLTDTVASWLNATYK
jgi:alpha-beta hydrolase superfamily lysophospholipase